MTSWAGIRWGSITLRDDIDLGCAALGGCTSAHALLPGTDGLDIVIDRNVTEDGQRACASYRPDLNLLFVDADLVAWSTADQVMGVVGHELMHEAHPGLEHTGTSPQWAPPRIGRAAFTER